jgi:hypothetical protein
MERDLSRQAQRLEDVGTYFGYKDGWTPLTSGLEDAWTGAGTERESRKGRRSIRQLPKRESWERKGNMGCANYVII